jgi:opacity protein-like surface antigen
MIREGSGTVKERRAIVLLTMVAAALLLSRPSSGDERFPRWTKDFTLAGGYSISHSVDSVEGITGFHLLPHYGVFVTEEWGPRWAPDWTRGTLEVIAEPTFVHLDTRESDNHGGLNLLGRWVFAASGRWRAYVEAGAGLLVGESGIEQTDCAVLFTLHAGAGVLFFLTDRNALSLGYRFHHISNSSACDGNFSLNSAVFSIGLSTFFP